MLSQNSKQGGTDQNRLRDSVSELYRKILDIIHSHISGDERAVATPLASPRERHGCSCHRDGWRWASSGSALASGDFEWFIALDLQAGHLLAFQGADACNCTNAYIYMPGAYQRPPLPHPAAPANESAKIPRSWTHGRVKSRQLGCLLLNPEPSSL
jgi:hypothetical protein